MVPNDRILRSRRVVTPRGVGPATIVVRQGRIHSLADWGAGNEAASTGEAGEDYGDLAILPGIVDTHVHVNEPGRTEWEGFASATRAAAAGGVTTLVDMPLNAIPPTTTVDRLAVKRRAALAAGPLVDVGFWGGVVPENRADLEGLARAGVLGFKAFLSPSGVDEFPSIGEDDLRAAAHEIRRLEIELGCELPLLVHAEWPAALERAARSGELRDPTVYRGWLVSRPVVAESEAITRLAAIARQTGARIHVVHLSCGEGAARVAAARSEGLRFSGETCPHYLTFAAEEIPDGAVECKCAPPIRGEAEREALWSALGDGSVALVASDHSPCPPAMKRRDEGDFFAAWGGIASLQLSLAATWTQARRRGFDLSRIAEWMAAAPARLAGLAGRKGSIEPGRDADLVVFDPEASFRVDPATLFHRHALTPYAGCVLDGRVRATYLRGEAVFRDGRLAPSPRGELLGQNAAEWRATT